MNISKREKVLLLILLPVLITFLYYQFIYTKQSDSVKLKRSEKEEIQLRYDEVMKNIKSLESKEEEINKLKNNVTTKAISLYPDIIQEKIILEVDKLLIENNIVANIGFNEVEVTTVENMNSDEPLEMESSLKEYVNSYNNLKSKENTYESNEDESTKNREVSEENITDISGETTTETNSGESQKDTTEQLKVSINFSCSYEDLKSFIEDIENYERKVVITNIAISSKDEDKLTGSLNLEFHSIPKISGDDEEYLKWTLINVYGKENLFSGEVATGAYAASIEDEVSDKYINDFAILVKSSLSELPTLTMGKANDDLRETYLTEDNNDIEEASIAFDEVDGKTYYKYNTSNSYYPSDSSNGKEFTSNSEDIVIEITSEKRDDISDKSALKLNVINNTNKKVKVIIKNDDSTNPRVKVISKGNTVNITNE